MNKGKNKICSIIFAIVALALFVFAIVQKKKNDYVVSSEDYSIVSVGIIVSVVSVVSLFIKNKAAVVFSFIGTLAVSVFLFKQNQDVIINNNGVVILDYPVLDVLALILFVVSAVFALVKGTKWAKIVLIIVTSYLFVKGIVAFSTLVFVNKLDLVMLSYYALAVVALMASVFAYSVVLLNVKEDALEETKAEETKVEE